MTTQANQHNQNASVRLFLAFLAPQEVDAYARLVIQELGDRYQTRTAYAPPHITLQAPFLWPHADISNLTQALASFIRNYRPISIALSGFGHFGKRVVYIYVNPTDELMRLQSDLATHLANTFHIHDSKNSHRSFTPHMTVASRKLTPSVFNQIWADLKQRTVEFRYVSDRLTLLIYTDHQWQVLSSMELGK